VPMQGATAYGVQVQQAHPAPPLQGGQGVNGHGPHPA
jgi:hypothetical protein